MKTTKVAVVVAACVLTLMFAPRGAAQITLADLPVVRADNAASSTVAGNYSGFLCSEDLDQIEIVDDTDFKFGNTCGQQFSIGSNGAYVNRVQMELGAYNITDVPATCAFTIVITDGVSIIPFGPSNKTIGKISLGTTIFLQRNESVTVQPFIQNPPIPFSDSFPAIWLPPGNYYLVMMNNEACNVQDGFGTLDWDLNIRNSLKTVGTVGQAFSWNNSNAPIANYPNYPNYTNIAGQPLGPSFAFELDGPIPLPPTGGGKLQISRLVVEGPVTPPRGGPVEAQIGFLNALTGNLLGPLTEVTLNPGQIESVDLDLTPLVSRVGQRIEVQPVIAQSPNAAGQEQPAISNISASVQVLDEVTGFGTVQAAVPQMGNSGPGLGPQILAGGQTMRFDVVASGLDPCMAQIGFLDKNGIPLISNVPVNLARGTGTTVDLNSDTLGLPLGTRIEVQPVLTVTAPDAAVGSNSVCNGSVEVFDHLTGRTSTHQSITAGLPAVQSPAPSPQ